MVMGSESLGSQSSLSCCAEPVLTLQGHVLAQDMLPIKFSGVKHYSCWQLWAAALSLAELTVEHNREMTFAHKLG